MFFPQLQFRTTVSQLYMSVSLFILSSSVFSFLCCIHHHKNTHNVTDIYTVHHHQHGLSIIVVGASGDLAKKKTYPSLFDLFVANLLPKSTIIWGYARTLQTHQQLRDQLRPYIISSQHNTNNTHLIDSFLSKCYYQSGKSYGDLQAWKELITIMDQDNDNAGELQNRMFYFAIPPTVFGETSMAIHQTMMESSSRGWSRLVIEKPFGTILLVCQKLYF